MVAQGWNAAGMTFEQGSASPFDTKVYNHDDEIMHMRAYFFVWYSES
eukprot:COSAG05_NODE_8_length_40675_cov_148.837539_35_plen_47_part_00